MSRTWFLSVAIAVSVPAGFGQDVLKVAPERVTVEVDNAQVRVLRFKEPPGNKLPMHAHSYPYVVVGLTDDDTKYTTPDGKSEVAHSKAGAVEFSKPQTHAAENIGKGPSEAILIELKTKAAGAGVSSAGDAARLAPQQAKVEMENDLVRVVRFKVGAGEKLPMHEHPAAVTIYLTGGHVKTTLASGKTEETRSKAGEVRYSGPVKHANENLSGKATEVAVVELKTAAK